MLKKIVNPFHYLPLRQAWCWGIAALILASVFAWQFGLQATSITQINYLNERLWMATARQIVLWVLFTAILYVLALIFSRSKVRLGDVAAFNLFARIPFHLSLIVCAVPSVRDIMMAALSEDGMDILMQNINLLTIVGVVSGLFAVWYIFWTYKAFAESTNIKNGKGVGVFALGYIIAYVASGYIMMAF